MSDLSHGEQLAITAICDEGHDLAAVVDTLILGTGRRKRFRREILWRLSSMVDEGTYSPRTKELADEISATEYSFVHLLGSERAFMEWYYEDGSSFAKLAESNEVPEWTIRQCHTSILGRLAAMEESGHISPKIPRLREDLASWASSPEIPLSADLVERWLSLSYTETRIGTFIRNGLPLDQQEKLWRSSTPVYETRITKGIGPDNEDLGFSWLLAVYMQDKEGTFGRVSGNEYNRYVGSEDLALEELYIGLEEYAENLYLRLQAIVGTPPADGNSPDSSNRPHFSYEVLPQLVGGGWVLGRVWAEFEDGIVPLAEFTDNRAAFKMASTLSVKAGGDPNASLVSESLRDTMTARSNGESVDPFSYREGSEVSVDEAIQAHLDPNSEEPGDRGPGPSDEGAPTRVPIPAGPAPRPSQPSTISNPKGQEVHNAWVIARGLGLAKLPHMGFWVVVALFGLVNIGGYRYVVDSPSECPSRWVDGREVGAMAFKSGVYECVVESVEGSTVNIPVGERQGIMPSWAGLMIIVGAVFGFRGNQPYLYLSRVLRSLD